MQNAGGSTTQIEEIEFNYNGFPLRGAKNDGTCYLVNESVIDGTKLTDGLPLGTVVDNLLIESSDDKTYFEDPVLTFEDSMVYGCTLELTMAELKEFCDGSYWKHLMIY